MMVLLYGGISHNVLYAEASTQDNNIQDNNIQDNKNNSYEIKSIEIKGNKTTENALILREFNLKIGMMANDEQMEAARQAVQDLGLFKKVELQRKPSKPNGQMVDLVLTVHERWYILPVPRVGINSDGEESYGAQLRWDNVGGVNHQLRALWEIKDTAESNLGKTERYQLRYRAPTFRVNGRWGGNIALSQNITPTTNNDGNLYEAQNRFFTLAAERALGEKSPNQGFRVGGGVLWQDHETRGEFAPQADGASAGFFGRVDYRRIKTQIFSENAEYYGAYWEIAPKTSASDYNYQRQSVYWIRDLPLKKVEHESLHLEASMGTYRGGPARADFAAYSLGGGSGLRGYQKGSLQGNTFYQLRAEYLRPVFARHPDVRWLLIADVGQVGDHFSDVAKNAPSANIGIGVRWRVRWFVDVDLDVGVAMPLNELGKLRAFGGTR